MILSVGGSLRCQVLVIAERKTNGFDDADMTNSVYKLISVFAYV